MTRAQDTQGAAAAREFTLHLPCRAVVTEHFCNIPVSTCSKHAQILRLFQIPDLPAQLPVFLHKAKDARYTGQVD